MLHGSFANTSPDIRISITFGFHRKNSVLGQKAALSMNGSNTVYDEKRIFERSAVIQVAIDARHQHFNDEPAFTYEPFAGLDPISMAVICDLIRTLNDALCATSIIVTHDVAETFSFADCIYFLADGEVAAEGSPKQLLASKLPFVRQFIHSEKDGPVPFHVEAPAYKAALEL